MHTNNMSDQSSIKWETATSKNGVSFKVGREKTESVTEESTEAAATSKKDFGVAVSWPIVGTWTNTTDEVKARAAITRYKLWESNAIGGKYTLQFTSTEHYNYHFYDETGDSYGVNTWSNGDRFVQYDSDEPKIAYITGS